MQVRRAIIGLVGRPVGGGKLAPSCIEGFLYFCILCSYKYPAIQLAIRKCHSIPLESPSRQVEIIMMKMNTNKIKVKYSCWQL